jgi:hypothetical protein
MNDLRKYLNIVSESSSGGTSAGGIAAVANPLASAAPFEGAMTRVKEQGESDLTSPDVEAAPAKEPQKLEVGILEYGMWENSSLVANKKLKQRREGSHRGEVVRDVYGESEAPSERRQVVKSIYGAKASKDSE